MASKSTISILVKVEDANGGFKQIALDADGLRKIMEQNVKVTQEFQNKMFKSAAIISVVSGANNALNQLNTTLSNLTGESTNFAKAMAEANTMAGKDAAGRFC